MIDHIYCINLERRHDRREKIIQEFHNENVTNVEIWRATDGRADAPEGIRLTKPEYGCADSHIRLWKDMVDKGYKTALVFEDDAEILPGFNFKLEKILGELEQIQDWDYVNLGPWHSTSICESQVSQVLSKGQSLCTHCYLISRRGALKMHLWDAEDLKFPIDIQLIQNPVKTYYSNEMLATQGTEVAFVDSILKIYKGDIGFDRTYDWDFTIRSFIHNHGNKLIFVLIILFFIILDRLWKRV
jgi:GR25 family glycosyltransferase involved in LPS biosynthesis